MKSISLYVDQDTYLTRLHPFTKLCYVFMAICVTLALGKLEVFAAFVVFSLLLLIRGRVLRKAVPLIAFSLTILLTIFLIHGLFNQQNETLLFHIGALKFYKEGVLYAVRLGLNILNMLLAFGCFVLTTKPSDFVEDLERAGFSAKFGYVILSVFQILPQMSGTMSTIIDAQRSRGMETEGSLLTRAKSFLPLISPVVMSSLTNTRERAIALEVRGFGAKTKKTYLKEQNMNGTDKVLSLIMLVSVVASIVWRFIG